MTDVQPSTEYKTELRLLEAILFANDEPLSFAMMQDQLGASADVGALLEELQTHYQGRGIGLVENDGVWSFRTAPELAPLMKITKQPRRKLPKAASEVLAIIAYHQPVTRSEIESVRGVETSKGTLDLLLEIGWIRPGKRRETPGRPLTWKTTPDFLSHFNLSTLNELPGMEELKAAGLLDTRPILATLPTEGIAESGASDDDDYANWVEEE
ncbi:MAG: SMC-Scp complex subunit ScpB [Alphaproteobacteria bacterium]|nr:SMC-Scp complex subunit ScpB [Alphaproteobacteria bacterium]